MKKSDRQRVFDKYGGRCAYCGCELQKGWHVDHLEPVRRNMRDGAFINPEADCFDNYMPACPSCNINKHSMSLEDFRNMIANFPISLSAYSTQYKIARRYGLVKETDKPVIFYFETL